MKNVDLYGRVRHAVLIDGMSSREAARVFGVDPRTIAKMLAFSFPPGYRRSQPVRRPKLDAFTGIIDQTLEADKLVPKKQRHTSKRIFERLRDEHDFEGGIHHPDRVKTLGGGGFRPAHGDVRVRHETHSWH